MYEILSAHVRTDTFLLTMDLHQKQHRLPEISNSFKRGIYNFFVIVLVLGIDNCVVQMGSLHYFQKIWQCKFIIWSIPLYLVLIHLDLH